MIQHSLGCYKHLNVFQSPDKVVSDTFCLFFSCFCGDTGFWSWLLCQFFFFLLWVFFGTSYFPLLICLFCTCFFDYRCLILRYNIQSVPSSYAVSLFYISFIEHITISNILLNFFTHYLSLSQYWNISPRRLTWLKISMSVFFITFQHLAQIRERCRQFIKLDKYAVCLHLFNTSSMFFSKALEFFSYESFKSLLFPR